MMQVLFFFPTFLIHLITRVIRQLKMLWGAKAENMHSKSTKCVQDFLLLLRHGMLIAQQFFIAISS